MNINHYQTVIKTSLSLQGRHLFRQQKDSGEIMHYLPRMTKGSHGGPLKVGGNLGL